MKQGFKAVLFDLDGVLVDTKDYIKGAFNHALESKGIKPINDEELTETAGLSLYKIYPELAPSTDVEEMIFLHRQFQKANSQLIKMYKDAGKVLEILGKEGIKTAIVSGRFRESINATLEKTGLGKLVDFTLAGDETEFGKPHPMPFSVAAKKLGVKAENCLVVGDGCSDIESGKAAGCKTCRAEYGYGANFECIVSADYEINSIREVLDIVIGQKLG